MPSLVRAGLTSAAAARRDDGLPNARTAPRLKRDQLAAFFLVEHGPLKTDDARHTSLGEAR